jgi:hypothetical protein
MKKLLLFALTLMLLAGCKKIIQKTQEQIAEDIIVKAMTDGQWAVTAYSDGTDYLPEFNGYKFQFKSNRTVDALKNAVVESTGNWQGDGYAMTINSNFPVTANATLQRLNGTWKIVNNNWTWVKANQTINGKTTTLELRKL